MAFAAEEFEGQTVKSLKTLVAKQIGVSRFRQRWLSEDHSELKDDAFVSASDVQLIVLDFVEAEDGEVNKLFDACAHNFLGQVDELLRKPLNPNGRDHLGRTALHLAPGGGRDCYGLEVRFPLELALAMVVARELTWIQIPPRHYLCRQEVLQVRFDSSS